MDTQAYISSGVIEAYVMGLATEEEIQILECVQKHNADVKQAVIDAQKALEDLATHQAVAPPAHLKKNIWAAIQEEDAKDNKGIEEASNQNDTAETPTIKSIQPNKVESKNYYKVFAIAASIAFLVGIGAVMYLIQQKGELQTKVAQLEQVNTEKTHNYAELLEKWNVSSNPEMKTVVLAGVERHPGTKAIVYVDKSTKQTYLSVENLPECPAGHAYQLWAIVDGKPVDAGMYEYTGDPIQKMHVIENAQAFAITLEKEGGSKVPTMDQMYVMGEV